jgi:Ser/Thr protein kinase RdoA (MazF antagonist)
MLTARELDVLRLIVEGCTNDEIADRLVISVRTVERLITALYAKTGSRGRADTAVWAVRNGLAWRRTSAIADPNVGGWLGGHSPTTSRCPTDSSAYSLIHSDLHPQNIVLSADGLAVIDFDDSGFGWHVYELAVALFRTQGRTHYEASEAALIARYRQQRTLSEAARRLLPMFILVLGLAVLGWANARPELDLASRMLPFRERVLGQAEAFLAGRLRF